jgi:hypothetical protein
MEAWTARTYIDVVDIVMINGGIVWKTLSATPFPFISKVIGGTIRRAVRSQVKPW